MSTSPGVIDAAASGEWLASLGRAEWLSAAAPSDARADRSSGTMEAALSSLESTDEPAPRADGFNCSGDKDAGMPPTRGRAEVPSAATPSESSTSGDVEAAMLDDLPSSLGRADEGSATPLAEAVSRDEAGSALPNASASESASSGLALRKDEAGEPATPSSESTSTAADGASVAPLPLDGGGGAIEARIAASKSRAGIDAG